MSSQIFKNTIPNELLIKLLNSIAIKTEKCYVINNNTYKKGLFNNTIINFIDECKPYYHISKRKYLERKLSYNSFITVIRQICKFNKITYTSQIKYDKSSYDIIYYIYLIQVNQN
jgi:hypothetical protein